MGFLLGILAVVVSFGFIIFIHELGHFLTARAVDIRCPQFAVGFGPSLFSFRWRGTNFAVRAFPFGGYVMMNGEEPGDRSEDPWAHAVDHYLGEAEFPATPQSLLEVL
ncbi:MAG: site-2 protease family protein, partial [Vulcanimicrobiota bacterium]